MITTIDRQELVRIGAGLRAAYLTRQAGYTLGIAHDEGDALAALLDAGYADEVAAANAEVTRAMGDRELADAEAKTLTSQQDRKVREAKVWRRKLAKRAARRRRMGFEIPDELATVGRASGVPELMEQLTTKTATFALSLEAMGGASAQALLDEGKRIHDELGSADAAQETARLSSLPKKVQDFYAAKGLLYTGLKVINDAGQELHSDDAASAGRYNLKILHRHAGTGIEAQKPVKSS